MAEDADELLPKLVGLNRESIHRLRQRLVNGFFESAHIVEAIRAASAYNGSTVALRAKFREHIA